MRGMLLTFMLLSCLPGEATPHCGPALWVVSDLESQYDCGSPLLEFMNHDLEFELVCPNHPDSLRRLESTFGSLPDEFGEGLYSFVWFADQVQGDPLSGLVLTWDPPLASQGGGSDYYSRFLIGKLMFSHAYSPLWLAEDYPIDNLSGWLRFTDNRGEVEATEYGMVYRINCTSWPFDCCEEDCCWDPPFTVTAIHHVDPPNGSTVSGDFDLAFDVESWNCSYSYPLPYSGFVVALGDTVLRFAGEGTNSHQARVHTGGTEPGAQFIVLVKVAGAYALPLRYQLATTGLRRDSFSQIKSRY